MELIHVTSLFLLNDICEQSLFRLLRSIMSEHVGDGVRPSVMSGLGRVLTHYVAVN